MNKSRLWAGLSAAVIAFSTAAALPAYAEDDVPVTAASVSNYGAAYDLIDVVNAFKNAGINSTNIQTLRNFLILNDEYFSSSDYYDFIYTINRIRDLYFTDKAKKYFGKTPGNLTENERYALINSLTNAERNAIDSALIKTAKAHGVLLTFDTDENGYTVVYGSMYKVYDGNNKSSSTTVKTPAAWQNFGFDKYTTSKSVKKDLADAKVSLTSSYMNYSNSKYAPRVTITYGGTKLTKGTDYTLSYTKSSSGKVRITITGKGSYTGTRYAYYYLVPDKAVISKAASTASGKMSLAWAKNGYASGYQIQLANNSGFSSAKAYVVKSGSVTGGSISGLASGKKYYVRIRAYRLIDGKRYYGSYSTTKYVTVK